MHQASAATPAEALGATIRRLRLQAGVTVTDLATQTGVTKGHLSRIERGERPVPEATYRRLVDALASIASQRVAS